MIIKKLKGPGPDFSVPLAKEITTLGRDGANDLALPDPAVSARHATVVRVQGEYSIYDLYSTNGVQVNGVKGPMFKVQVGDRISIGDTVMALDAGGPEEAAPARREITQAPRDAGEAGGLDAYRGQSAAMQDVKKRILQVAPLEIPVLLKGETGTGKSIAARLIHEHSRRNGGPLVAIDCPTIPAELMESELFGHCRGSFTGAAGDKLGKVEAADGGTLFLDEIGELPLSLQPKLLRFLQEKRFERVGEVKTREVNIRLVAATNRDLAREAAEGRFRLDLYYRLDVIDIQLPPLRERGEDVLLLAEEYVKLYSRQLGKKRLPFSEAARLRLRQYPWPGNIRELQNVLQRALILSEPGQVELDLSIGEGPAVKSPERGNTLNLKILREGMEREAITRALQKYPDNRSKAAEELGVDRHTLKSLMEKYGM